MLAELGISPNRVDELQNVPVSRLLAAMAEVSKRQAAAPGSTPWQLLARSWTEKFCPRIPSIRWPRRYRRQFRF